MKLLVFVLTTLLLLVVAGQQSLAQAATNPEELQKYVDQFGAPPKDFYPQTDALEGGMSHLEGSADPIEASDRARTSTDVDRFADTRFRPEKSVDNRKFVNEALGGASPRDSAK